MAYLRVLSPFAGWCDRRLAKQVLVLLGLQIVLLRGTAMPHVDKNLRELVVAFFLCAYGRLIDNMYFKTVSHVSVRR